MQYKEQKAALRREIRAARRALPEGEALRLGTVMAEHLLRTVLWKGSRTVMAYAAFHGEPDLTALLSAALNEGKTLLMPRCEGERLSVRRITALTDLIPGSYGIPEPGEACPEAGKEAADLILVPGLAFSPAGIRLGQGAGYYDRFLPGTGAVCVGVCYAREIREVPRAPWDARMDWILTEEALMRRKEKPDG